MSDKDAPVGLATIAVTGTGDGLFLLKNMARPRLVP